MMNNDSYWITQFDVRTKINYKTVIINVVEIPLLAFAAVICFIFLGVVYRTTRIHVNLRVLLANFAVAFLVVQFSRFALIVPQLISFALNENVGTPSYCRLTRSVHNSGLYIGTLNIIFLVVERSLATVFVSSYEQKRRPMIIVVILTIQWVSSLLFVGAQLLNAPPGKAYMLPCQRIYTVGKTLEVVYPLLLSGNVFSGILFVILLCVNKRHHERWRVEYGRYTLSTRYQIAENIQTTRLLYPLVFVYIGGSLICIGLLIVAQSLATRGKALDGEDGWRIYVSGRLFGQSCDVVFALFSAVIPMLAIRGHATLTHQFRLAVRRPRAPDAAKLPRATDGKMLILTPGEERRLHFAQMANMWNKEPP